MNISWPWKTGSRGRLAVLTLLTSGLATVAACTTEGVLRPEIGVGSKTASVRPEIPVRPEIDAGRSSLIEPIGFPSMTRVPPAVMPDEEVQCRRELKRLGVTFRDLPTIDDGGGCGIDHPVEVSGLPGGVELKPAATLNCAMAEAFARWTKKELTPSARLRYFSGIRTIRQGSSYSCRTIGNRRGGTLSEHAKGNALDVMDITLKNGNMIDVRRPGLFAFRQRGLLNNVRGDACDYFTTVLGPGYDRAHKDHFHFDLKDRRSNYKACR